MQREIVETIKRGGVIVMLTDTVYGLVADASNPEAVKKLYETKGREGKPGTMIAASIEQLKELGLDGDQLEMASSYWPGPNSIILQTPDSLAYLHLGLGSTAVRIPDDEALRELLEQTGPLATTSANLPGKPVVSNIKQAKEVFGEKVALYVDGGETIEPKSSNVYKLQENGKFEQLR